MRITGISATLYEYPLSRPIGDVHLPGGASHGVDAAVTVHVDEPGLEGVTIGHWACAAAIAQFEPLLVGADPYPVTGLWHQMVAMAFKTGMAGSVKSAISAIDCALWDLRAKANGVPLWKELGATEGRVAVYASGLDSPLDDDELAAFYKSMAGQGVSAGKLKVGRDAATDERRLQIMQDELAAAGPPRLMIDANEFWTPKQAVQRVRALERSFSLTWVEEPVPRLDYQGLRQVTRAIDAPVATGENLNVAQEYAPLLTAEAVDVVQIGCLTGGITGALQIADLAAAFNRPVTMSNCAGRYMAHLAAALPHHTMMEVIAAGRDAALVSQPPIINGQIELGDEPGSGVAFDPALLAQRSVNKLHEPSLATRYFRAPDAGQVG